VNDIFDWVSRIVLLLGLPGVITYLVKERRKNNADARMAEADAEFAEEDLPNRHKTSSIVSLEAQVTAMQKTFKTDRENRDETIAFLRGELESEREASKRKDDRIRELEEKVQKLQARVSDLSRELAQVSRDLADLHSNHPEL
jgi:chromosome segregation ATPase